MASPSAGGHGAPPGAGPVPSVGPMRSGVRHTETAAPDRGDPPRCCGATQPGATLATSRSWPGGSVRSPAAAPCGTCASESRSTTSSKWRTWAWSSHCSASSPSAASPSARSQSPPSSASSSGPSATPPGRRTSPGPCRSASPGCAMRPPTSRPRRAGRLRRATWPPAWSARSRTSPRRCRPARRSRPARSNAFRTTPSNRRWPTRSGPRTAASSRSRTWPTLEHALPALTLAQRTVRRLRFEEDLRQSEIARRTGLSQMQVSRTLRAALERLQTLVESQSQIPAHLAA